MRCCITLKNPRANIISSLQSKMGICFSIRPISSRPISFAHNYL
uniref:Uncharacterized protein n=1 Tax=Arundo donax TaxID=35708 RepID=A0A0A9BVS6_ARUDO